MAAPGLEAFLDAELARHNLPPSALALVGFSQGTMMSLHVGLRRAVPPAAIVGYSGMLILEGDTDTEGYKPQIRARPPVLLIHGDSDDLIPMQAHDAFGAGPCRDGYPGRMAHFGRDRPRDRRRRIASGRGLSGAAFPGGRPRHPGMTA